MIALRRQVRCAYADLLRLAQLRKPKAGVRSARRCWIPTTSSRSRPAAKAGHAGTARRQVRDLGDRQPAYRPLEAKSARANTRAARDRQIPRRRHLRLGGAAQNQSGRQGRRARCSPMRSSATAGHALRGLCSLLGELGDNAEAARVLAQGKQDDYTTPRAAYAARANDES